MVSVGAINDFKATVQKIEQELQDFKEKQHVDKNIVDSTCFSGLPVYGGQAEKWDDWHFKMRSNLEKERAEFVDLLKYLDNAKEIPIGDVIAFKDEVELKAGVKKDVLCDLGDQLYQVLVAKFEGDALSTVKNHQN